MRLGARTGLDGRTGLGARIGQGAGACGLLLLVAGCQSAGTETRAYQAPGVPVALDTIEGAPDALKTRVNDEVASQATARRIELVSGSAAPRYTLRGYLTAYPTATGDTALAFVWDVFDASKKRTQRVSTTTVARGQSSDPWSQIGETQIAKTTSQSMNQVAAFLSGAVVPGSPAPTSSTAATGTLGFSGE